jgi:hypothetical protein
MKRFILTVVIAVVAVGAWGQQALPNPYDEAAAFIRSAAAMNWASLTGDDVRTLLSQLSVAVQKVTYVERLRVASWHLPGLGEFRAGDNLGGALFLTTHVVISAGTILTAYFLLPSNVRFSSLDYLTAPISTIKSTWEGNSIESYLPTAAVLAGGMVLDGVLRWLSATHAAHEGQENLAAGRVTFQPRLELGPRGMMMGMHWRW